MTTEDLITMLTEGLDAAEAATVRKSIERDAVKAKVINIKAQNEYQALVDREIALKAELEGGPDKPGAKAYSAWYAENFPKVQQLQAERAAYEAKFGKLDATHQTQQTQQTQQTGKTYTDEDIQRIVDSRFQTQLAPNIAGVLKGTGKLVQRHMFAGRKTEIDFDALDDLMGKKNLTLEQAYAEWDKPEREKTELAARESEIDRRVKEELQKRGTAANFPAAVESGPSALSPRPQAEVDKFDRTALQNDLVKTFMTGEYPS